ncbi:transposase family protein [Streptomyces sp. NPDC091406]|uniref:transposase family protein n=1 Tax=unclassified Streptomyces TaxID=2593676 RepID=UPI0038016983
MLIVDGTPVPTRDHTIAEHSKNYRYSTNTTSSSTLTLATSSWWAGNLNDCEIWVESAAKAAVGTTIADSGYQGAGLVMPHRRCKDEELHDGKQTHNECLKRVCARVEHVLARMKTWKMLRDCRLKGDGVHRPCSASPGCTTSPRRTDKR